MGCSETGVLMVYDADVEAGGWLFVFGVYGCWKDSTAPLRSAHFLIGRRWEEWMARLPFEVEYHTSPWNRALQVDPKSAVVI